jgi:hypothetical protein
MTMAYIAVAATVIGTAVSVGSQLYAADQAKEAADYNKKVDEMKAHDALQTGADQASAIRQKARRLASTQVEGSAMSGVQVNTGTALALLTDTAGLGELDALRTVNNAQRQAWGFQADSELEKQKGKTAQTTGILNATGSALSGAASTYNIGKTGGVWK